VFAGTISRRDGAHAFELFAVQDCQWVRVAGPLELDFHPLCSQNLDGSQSCTGERLIAASEEDHLTFVHFGGGWLDMVTAVQSEHGWEVDSDAWQL
jgi:hypothetical protein